MIQQLKQAPDVEATSRYSIKETCKLLNISRDTLRRYTDKGLIKCLYLKVNSGKVYLGSEIMKCYHACY